MRATGRNLAGRISSVVVPVKADGWYVRLIKDQASHVLTSLRGADALAIVPTDVTIVEAGGLVHVEVLGR